MPLPPPARPHEAGDSRGTTPRRYCSMATVLTTQVLAPEATIFTVPRYERRLPVGPQVRTIARTSLPGAAFTDAVGWAVAGSWVTTVHGPPQPGPRESS